MGEKVNSEVKVRLLLDNYQSDTQTIEVLRDALNRVPCVSAEDMINSMFFAHGEGPGGAIGHISDKTAYIALHYQKKLDSTNSDSSGNLAARLWEMEQARSRLQFFVSLLEIRQKRAIQLYYMEGVSREETAESLGVTVRTFHKIRKQAIERLAQMYELTCPAKG